MVNPLDPEWTNTGNGDVVRGSTTPRLWTPPLRELTPETSYGFELCGFADDIGTPFDPWQRWVAVHMGELLPDGRPRFRIVVILVSRQNGKTFFGKVLSAWWLFVDLPGSRYSPDEPLTVLAISSKVEYAKEILEGTLAISQNSPLLAAELPPGAYYRGVGEQRVSTINNTRMKIAAANDSAGRSLTVDRLLIDELRKQQTFTAWAAAEPTTSSVPGSQIVCLTNQGDAKSVVLDAHRKAALEFIETGKGDSTIGLFEWSAPDGADPTDVEALAASNPNLNSPDGRNPLSNLMGNALRAKAAGGEELAKFRTESMCQRVHVLDPAIDPDKWDDCGDADMPELVTWRDRVAAFLDVSLDQKHATLIGCAWVDEVAYLETIKAWNGEGCTAEVRRDLPGLVRTVRPRVFGYLPGGPAASIAVALSKPRKGKARRYGLPPGVKVEAITSDVVQVTMGFADLVTAQQVVHPEDPMMTAHIKAAQKLWRGDGWVYARKSAGPIDGAYAAAGAVHLARNLPPARGPLKLITAPQA